ncbi:MAG: hypothetical protein J0H17_13890 [Rhizobiales bacterium]|nr:hypothetical protein [Hyphomicrobiales bacterium]
MTTITEASSLIRRLAEPAPPGDSVKAAMRRAWRKLPDWSANRIRDVWHAEKRVRLRAEELEHLRKATAQEKAAKDELQELRARVKRLECLLENSAH